MSYRTNEQYLPINAAHVPALEGGLSELASEAIESLFRVLRNEGLTFYPDGDGQHCPDTGGTSYQYSPTKRELSVRASLPWPQARWYLAVAVGHHFTRHNFFEMRSQEEWRKQAEQWAITFLANVTEQRARLSIPDNSGKWTRNRSDSRKEVPPPKKQTRDRVKAKCKATKSNGKRCRAYRTPGTAFCQHHQNQQAELPTLADVLNELVESSRQDSGGSK